MKIFILLFFLISSVICPPEAKPESKEAQHKTNHNEVSDAIESLCHYFVLLSCT